MPLSIGLVYDLQKDYIFYPDDPPDAWAEFDSPRIINLVTKSLTQLGYKVIKIGNVYSLIRRLHHLKCDIVFNNTEGQRGRNRESQAPILLEMVNMPFVGSDGVSMAMTLDKVLAKKMMASQGVLTPRYFSSEEGTDYARLMQQRRLAFPLFVKPQYEGSSKGLNKNSKVSHMKGLISQIKYVEKHYRQPALVEEFIRGQEYTALIIGNEMPVVYPLVRIEINAKGRPADRYYTSENCRQEKDINYVCTELEDNPTLKKKLTELTVKTFKALQCRDFSRVDFRIGEHGQPYVLEINPLPCLANNDVFGAIAEYLKIPYYELLGKVITAALTRNHLPSS